MPKKPKSERVADRPTEDDIAQAELGGPRGAAELPPAKLKRKTATPAIPHERRRQKLERAMTLAPVRSGGATPSRPAASGREAA
jgi:hypothetical protein